MRIYNSACVYTFTNYLFVFADKSLKITGRRDHKSRAAQTTQTFGTCRSDGYATTQKWKKKKNSDVPNEKSACR